ncbi:MAG: hypothetical protein M1827_003432 [Pycnora praestabilis]|nr:MAG: hypothetical protein M1827_003432 [Pycnora praestabilis]
MVDTKNGAPWTASNTSETFQIPWTSSSPVASLKDIRESNRKLNASYSELVAVFVGATSGIGQSTLKKFAQYANKPRAYIVGRSQKAALPLLKELRSLNSEGAFAFVETDITLLTNIDKACGEIKSKEKKINLLFMSPGYLNFGGIETNADGVDSSIALRYYGRMRFVQNLLPLMNPPISRVVSVLGGGKEAWILEDDLYLRKVSNYTWSNANNHSATMNTLALKKFADDNPDVGFVHVFPGAVNTPLLTRGRWWFVRLLLLWIILPILSLFTRSVDEAGERQLFYATSARYAAPAIKDSSDAGVPVLEKIPSLKESEFRKKSGMYNLDEKGESVGDESLLRKFHERGTDKKVWEHTMEVFENRAR